MIWDPTHRIVHGPLLKQKKGSTEWLKNIITYWLLSMLSIMWWKKVINYGTADKINIKVFYTMYVTRQACMIGKRDGQSITSHSKPACTLPPLPHPHHFCNGHNRRADLWLIPVVIWYSWELQHNFPHSWFLILFSFFFLGLICKCHERKNDWILGFIQFKSSHDTVFSKLIIMNDYKNIIW